MPLSLSVAETPKTRSQRHLARRATPVLESIQLTHVSCGESETWLRAKNLQLREPTGQFCSGATEPQNSQEPTNRLLVAIVFSGIASQPSIRPAARKTPHGRTATHPEFVYHRPPSSTVHTWMGAQTSRFTLLVFPPSERRRRTPPAPPTLNHPSKRRPCAGAARRRRCGPHTGGPRNR
jgi:hypothetical protein